MKIEWNKVTWYSKLLAAVLLVVTFAIAFSLGARYEALLGSWADVNQHNDGGEVVPTPAAKAGLGEHCGGFIRNAPECGQGLHCELALAHPDTGGVCVADAASGGQGIAPYQSGVSGTVTLGPTCPVMKDPPDPACADKAYATTISVSRAGSSAVFATGASDADGIFRIALPPGDYTVSAHGGSQLPRCSPVTATVGATGYTATDISCDTGIR